MKKFLLVIPFLALLLGAPHAFAASFDQLPVTIVSGHVAVDISSVPSYSGANGVYLFNQGSNSFPGTTSFPNSSNSYFYSGGHVCINSSGTICQFPDATFGFPPDGEYWYAFQDFFGNTYYFEFGVAGGSFYVPATVGGDTSTHVIQINQPTSATTTASTTVDINFDLNQNLATPADGYSISIVNASTGQNVFPGDLGEIIGTFATTTSGVQNIGTSTVLALGSYTMRIALCQTITIVNQDGTSSMIPCGANIDQGKQVQFSVLQNVLPGVDGFDPNALSQGTQFASTTCAITFSGTFNLGDCVGYIVYPSQSTLDQFSTLTLNGRFPFAYAYQLPSLVTDLFPATTTGTTTIQYSTPGFANGAPLVLLSSAEIAAVPFAPLIKTVLGYLIWLLGIEVIYLTIIRSHNKDTGV